ncbi:unnamed protein product, partial [marine sediment metagenome]
YDYLKSIASEENFTLVCEIPYFYHNSIEDTSLTEFERRDLRIQSLEYMKNIYKHSKKIFRHIRKFCDKSTRIYTAVEDYIRRTRLGLELEINDAKTSSMYEGKATVSQAFDANVSSRYYDLLNISMITRLCKEAISNYPENEVEIAKIKSDLEKWVEQKINELLSRTKFEVEGRGTFRIPEKPIPLTAMGDTVDICGVLSVMLENGDTTWITLEPREVGEQTIQIFLESVDGTIIEGKTRSVKVVKNFKDNLKKITSIGSLLGGLAV